LKLKVRDIVLTRNPAFCRLPVQYAFTWQSVKGPCACATRADMNKPAIKIEACHFILVIFSVPSVWLCEEGVSAPGEGLAISLRFLDTCGDSETINT